MARLFWFCNEERRLFQLFNLAKVGCCLCEIIIETQIYLITISVGIYVYFINKVRGTFVLKKSLCTFWQVLGSLVVVLILLPILEVYSTGGSPLDIIPFG